MSWGEMAGHLGWGTVLEEGWRKGPWTAEEDRLLIEYVKLHGEGRWNSVATLSGLKRNGKSCRLRWVNYLRPDLKRGQITPHEESIILELHARWGNRWSTIARSLPGRTDNEIKNYWRTHFKKKAKSSSDNTEKAKARLLRRQQIQQQQQQQRQQMNQLAEIKRIMSSLLEENDDKLAPSSLAPPQVIMRQDMEIVYPNNTASDDDHHQEQQGFLNPPFNNNGYASHHITPNQPHQEDNIFWDGLWNLDDIHGSNLISMPFGVPNKTGLHNLVTPSFY